MKTDNPCARVQKFCEEWQKMKHNDGTIMQMHINSPQEAQLTVDDLRTLCSAWKDLKVMLRTCEKMNDEGAQNQLEAVQLVMMMSAYDMLGPDDE